MPWSPANPALSRLKTQLVVAVAASYALDALLLGGYVYLGALGAWPVLLYTGLGLGECALSYTLIRRRAVRQHRDVYLAVPRLAVSCVIQLLFIALAPSVGLYFTGVLFIVFAFATLRVNLRDAFAILALVGGVLALLLGLGADPLALPHALPAERALTLLALLTILARVTLLGVFSSYLRGQVGCRYREVKSSLQCAEDDRTRTAMALHEDIGQDLAGIALSLSAYSARLRRQQHADAAELDAAAAQLRQTAEKARVLAFPALPGIGDAPRRRPNPRDR